MIRRLVAHTRFETVVTAAVVLAAVMVGVESYPHMRALLGPAVSLINVGVLAVFGIELAARLLAHDRSLGRFLGDGWNLFDTVLFLLAIVPLTAGLAGAIRLVRLVRVIRLVRAMPKLRMLVMTTLSSMPSIVSIGALLTLLFYVYAVGAVHLFGDNDPVHFGDLHTAIVTLFRVITLEDWTDVMYTQMHGCADYGYESMPTKCTASTAWGPIGAVYFISFVFAGTWVMLNLFIGVIMTGMDAARIKVEEATAPPPSAPRPSPVSEAELVDEIEALRRGLRLLEAHRRWLHDSVGYGSVTSDTLRGC